MVVRHREQVIRPDAVLLSSRQRRSPLGRANDGENRPLDYRSQGAGARATPLLSVKSKSEYLGAGFRYEGPFEYVKHEGKHPTRFTLRRASTFESVVASDLGSLRTEEEYFEGTKNQRFVNYYERDKNLRTAAVEHHGLTCKVCGFNFEQIYGERGKDYIEVHHLRPVSTLGKETKVDPKSDMTVLCSNCHRMIHRRKDDVLTPEELKRLLRK